MKGFIVILVMLGSHSLWGQSVDPGLKGRWVVSGGIGAHLGLFFQGYGEGKARKKPPALAISADNRLGKVVELGFQVGWSPAEAFLGEIARFQGAIPEEVSITGRRTVVGLRTIFHFTQSENMDLYSGLRVGVRHISRKTNTGYYNYRGLSDITSFHLEGIDRKTFGFGAQLVLLGYRYFFSENWGFGMETAVGGPYYASVQLIYRVKKQP